MTCSASPSGAPVTAKLPLPAADTADIWLVRLQALPASASRHPFLAADERANAKADHDRSATRLALRILLGDYCSIHPADLRFAEGPHGKPELPPPAPSFSVARRAELALIAVAAAGPIGVDIEECRPLPELEMIAAMLHPEERAALAGASVSDRERQFYRIWTRKEAALKAQGVGIAEGLDAFSVARGPECPIPGAPTLRLHDLPLRRGYCGALSTESRVTRANVRALPSLTHALLEAGL